MHSTETAVLKVFSDIVDAIEKGEFALLTLLDLSAAFDTVDHEILLKRLSTTFGINSVALQWFRSYMADRTQSVHLGSDFTSPRPVTCGVPQGSVLGPILFSLYTADIGKLIISLSLQHHCYADETQLYESCRPDDRPALKARTYITVHRCNCRMDGIKPPEIKSYKDGIYVVLYLATTVPCWWFCFQFSRRTSFNINIGPEPWCIFLSSIAADWSCESSRAVMLLPTPP